MVAFAAIIFTMLPVSPARALLGSVSSNWPSSRLARATNAYVSGHVTGLELSNAVFLQQKVLGGWRNMATAKLDSNRNYRLKIPTWWVGTRTYRVMTGSLLNTTLLGTASKSWGVSVKPAYKPAGLSSNYKFTSSSMSRWDPCKKIGYRVYPGAAGTGGIKDTKTAMSRMSQATGYSFVYRGTTTRVPQNGGNSWYPSDTQIVVAWAKPSQSSMLRSFPNAVGVGATVTSGGWANGDGTSTSKIIRGAVVIDSRRKYAAGFGLGHTRGDVILHEVGHAMGLAHTSSSSQIMYPYVTKGYARHGHGDLRGLWVRGARNGCIVAPKYRTAGSTTLKVHVTP